MTLVTRPHSRLRATAVSLLLVAAGLWVIGAALAWGDIDLRRHWLLASTAGALLVFIGSIPVTRDRFRVGIVTAGTALALGAAPNIATLMAAVVVMLVTAALIGGRRAAVCLLAVGGTFVLRSVVMLARDPHVDVLRAVVDNGFGVLLLVLGWYIGTLVHRAEVATDQLWLAHRRLELGAATERELVLAEERARAAQELHDGLGHRLTLISMSLDFAGRVRERDPQAAWAEVAQAGDTASAALADMRAWVRAMAPPSPSAGLGPMLDSLATSFRTTGLVVEVSHAGPDGPLPDDVALFVTRLVQESLTNVIKHSDATHVHIDAVTGDDLRVVVVDDGTAGSDAPLQEGFGLRSLRERADALGGWCRFSRTPTGGFRTTATLPLAGAGVPA